MDTPSFSFNIYTFYITIYFEILTINMPIARSRVDEGPGP